MRKSSFRTLKEYFNFIQRSVYLDCSYTYFLSPSFQVHRKVEKPVPSAMIDTLSLQINHRDIILFSQYVFPAIPCDCMYFVSLHRYILTHCKMYLVVDENETTVFDVKNSLAQLDPSNPEVLSLVEKNGILSS